MLFLGQICSGGKVLQLTCLHSHVRFIAINSMSFFTMRLPSSSKSKGYFPHLFNADDHQEYIGPLPAEEFYMPDGMFVKDSEAFRHDQMTQASHLLDFHQELLDYCKSDVQFRKQGCLTFNRDSKAKARFDPLEQIPLPLPAVLACVPTAFDPSPSPANLCWVGAVSESICPKSPSNGSKAI